MEKPNKSNSNSLKDSQTDQSENGISEILKYYNIIKSIKNPEKSYVIEHKKSKEVFLCKHFNKKKIIDYEKYKQKLDILLTLDHPNILKLYEIFETKRSLYLILEYCKGETLYDKVINHIEKNEMYSEQEALIIFKQIISAIDFSQKNGIIHQELNLEDLIYLNKGDEKNNPLKLNLIKYKSKDETLKQKLNKPYYNSPEFLSGKYTNKSNLWNAGVILYILLGGEPPFKGGNDYTIYNKINEVNFNFGKKWDNISESAKDLISHLLIVENERYDIQQIFEHPWMNNGKVNKKILSFNFQRSSRYNRVNVHYEIQSITYISSIVKESDNINE